MPQTYSNQFCAPAAAEQYDAYYRAGTADQILWEIEQMILQRIVQELKRTCARIEYLDFACGTGRVISFLEEQVQQARGIDISREMIQTASTRVHRSELVCENILEEESPGRKYDLITAFRFFLNAEPALRKSILAALRARLRNRSSRLVFTNHGNPWSYKAVLWPWHRTRQMLRGTQRQGNYLTHQQITGLLRESGLEMVERIGFGFITPKLVRFAPVLAGRWERRLAGKGALSAWGVNQLYVVRLMG